MPATWLLDRQLSIGKPTCAACSLKTTQGYWNTIKQNEKTGGRWAHVKCVKGGYRDDDTIHLVNPAGKNSMEEILADMEMKAPRNHRTMFADEDDNVGDANMTQLPQ